MGKGAPLLRGTNMNRGFLKAGYSKQFTSNYQAGFLLFALLALLALAGLMRVKRRWRATWGTATSLGTARI